MDSILLIPVEVDRLFRYRAGTAERLAKRGRLAHIVLPDGSIRFRKSDIAELLSRSGQDVQEVAHA